MPHPVHVRRSTQRFVILSWVPRVILDRYETRKDPHRRLVGREGLQPQRDGVAVGNLMDQLTQELVQTMQSKESISERPGRIGQSKRLPHEAHRRTPAEKM